MGASGTFLLDEQRTVRHFHVPLPAAGAPDLRRVVVRMSGIDPEPVVDGVAARIGVLSAAYPLLGGQGLQQLQARGAHCCQDPERGCDGSVVVDSASVEILVVGDDHRLVLGDEPAQPDEAVGLTVGKVMGDVPGGPASVGRGPVQIRVGDVGEGIHDGTRPRPVLREESGPIDAHRPMMPHPSRQTQ